MERQFTRFDDIDHRFDVMDGNLMNVMEKQAGVGGTINILNDKISALMDMIAQVHIQTGQVSGGTLTTLSTEKSPALASIAAASTEASISLPAFPNCHLDRFSFSSPI